MHNTASTPPAEWVRTQRAAIEAKIEGRFLDAVGVVSRYLANGEPSAQAEALAFRAVLREELQDFAGARADVTEGLRLAAEPSYLRYTLQLSLASLDERSGDRPAAIAGYLAAITTATREGRISIGTAVSRLLELIAPSDLSSDQRQGLVEAVRASWRVLGLEGEPDAEDLKGTAARLLMEQSRFR